MSVTGSAEKYTFPAVNGAPMAALCVPVSVIPFLRRFFSEMQQRHIWKTRGDWLMAYQVFAQMEEWLMGGCMRDLLERQDQLYRLLDTALNGTQYTATTDPATQLTTIAPAIPATPPASATAPGAVRAQLARLHQLAENAATGQGYDAASAMDGTVGLDWEGAWRARLEALQGTINAGWFGIGGQPATIADIVNALRVGDADQSQNILQTLQDMLATGANAVSIFGFVEDLFSDTVNASGEGAILATLIASSMANAAMLGAMSAQINRLVNALDGGATPAPTTNVVSELNEIRTLLG